MRSVSLLLTLFLLTISSQIAAQSDTSKAFVKVDGEVLKPLKLYKEDLAKMKRSTISVKGRDGKEHSYTGVSLQVVLEMAGVTTGKDLRGENLSKYLLAKCADGYEVVFSLAEFDSSFTDRVILLADTSDGNPLPAAKGPFQLAVPGEKKPARSCFQLSELLVRFAKE